VGANPVRSWFELDASDLLRAWNSWQAVFQLTLEKLPVEGMKSRSLPMDHGRYGAGCARGRRDGMAPAGGQVILLMDTEASTNWLHLMVREHALQAGQHRCPWLR
jgi:predicted enzyme related to lactoylglutathione lyase